MGVFSSAINRAGSLGTKGAIFHLNLVSKSVAGSMANNPKLFRSALRTYVPYSAALNGAAGAIQGSMDPNVGAGKGFLMGASVGAAAGAGYLGGMRLLRMKGGRFGKDVGSQTMGLFGDMRSGMRGFANRRGWK
jgi:hypothetical protein